MKPQREPNGTFLSQIRDPLDPKRRLSIRGDTEEECIKNVFLVRQRRREIQLGIGNTAEHYQQLRAIADGPLTLEKVWADYVRKKDPQARAQHQNTWRNWFAPTFGTRLVGDIGAELMGKWERDVAAWPDPPACTTIATQFAMLRAAVRPYVPSRLPDLPWGKWRPVGLGKPAGAPRSHLRSIDEMRAVLLAARKHDDRLRAQWITHGFADLERRLLVAFLCGLRNGELGGLGWDDIRFDEDEQGAIMSVSHQVSANWRKLNPGWSRPLTPPKGRRGTKARNVKPQRVHPDAVLALLAQRDELTKLGWWRADGPVFPNPRNGAWRDDETCIKPALVRQIVTESGVAVDVKNFTTHSTRHTFASLETAAIVMQGGSLRDVAERTRHRDMGALMVYVHKVGHGLVAPGVGRLSMPAELPRLEAVREGEFDVLEAPAVELVTRELGAAYQRDVDARELVEKEVRYSKGGGRGWREAAEAWISAGKKGRRPPEVSADFQRKYTAAYVKSLRATNGDKAAAQKAGFQSKRASEARWARLVKLVEGGGGVAKGRADENDERSAASEGDDRVASGSVRGAVGVRRQ